MLFYSKAFFLVIQSFAVVFSLTGYASVSPVSEKDSEASLEFKIGQMLLIGFRGLEVSDQHTVIRDIREL
ncbi:MAG: hypothetical protein ACJAYS_001064, partial [Lentimonas sp.]